MNSTESSTQVCILCIGITKMIVTLLPLVYIRVTSLRYASISAPSFMQYAAPDISSIFHNVRWQAHARGINKGLQRPSKNGEHISTVV